MREKEKKQNILRKKGASNIGDPTIELTGQMKCYLTCNVRFTSYLYKHKIKREGCYIN